MMERGGDELGALFGRQLASRLWDDATLGAEAELRRLKAAPLLDGIRGAAGVDVAAIARVVAAIGAMMRANPAIAEIDVNPLLAYPAGSANSVLALDALVVVRRDEDEEAAA